MNDNLIIIRVILLIAWIVFLVVWLSGYFYINHQYKTGTFDISLLTRLKILFKQILIKLHIRKPSYCDSCTLLDSSKITCRWPSTRTVKTVYGYKDEKFYESVKIKNIFNTCSDFTPIQNKDE